MTARNRAINKITMNIPPNTDWDNLNIGSELRVAVEGRPPKYAAKKIPIKIAPIPCAINKNVFVCLSLSFNNFTFFM